MVKECPICGSKKIKYIDRTEVFEYKGRKIFIEDFYLTHCNTCGEDVAEKESRDRSVSILRDAQRTVDGYLTSCAIKKIRKNLGFTQDEFGKLLGGGEKAFARYENGKILQSKPMDNLLRILKKYPKCLNAIYRKKVSEVDKIKALSKLLFHD